MAVEPKTTGFEEELTERQKVLITKLADWTVRKRMTTPAILFLESVRPLNFVGSQVMVFFAPVVNVVFNMPEWNELQAVLERRESIAYVLDLIEEKEAEYLTEESIRKQEAKARKNEAKKK